MRPSWDEYFLSIVDTVAQRGTCDRGKSGCVIVRDRRLLTTGYVGSLPGDLHCDDVGHKMMEMINDSGQKSSHCVRTIHAEQNAIVQAARFGISLEDAWIYCTMEPCLVCARLIFSSGIVRVIAKKRYHAGQNTRDLFLGAGVHLFVIDDSIEEYNNVT